jgi:superfamily II DNA or RNA helicase
MIAGTRVRLTSDPGRIGIVTGKSRQRGGRQFWQVMFPDGSQYISEKQLETIFDEKEDALDLFKKGKFGRARDLRGAITHIRLSGRLADLIYSMETTNTDFYPYQFKPVLNFLDSPSGGILIADEVGLGKTIEAGLIWTELRSRYDTRRLMVLCPAMLREKWKIELQRRFGINAVMTDATEALDTFREYRAGNLSDFAIVASMQGLRPNRGWDDDPSVSNKNSVKLAKFLSDNAHDSTLLDLLIIDEAHYLRNPQSMTAKLGRLLRRIAEHVVLLSATPIHLKNQDLYHLLNLVDEDSFNQVHVFDDILQANSPLIQARDLVLQGNIDPDNFLELIGNAASHILLSDNRQLKHILNNPPGQTEFSNTVFRSELAQRLESINLLGKAVTRTRKREVTEWRVLRQAYPEIIEMTPVEAHFYNKVTSLVRQYSIDREAHEAFLLVTPQRQIASSMPAALREWQHRRLSWEQMEMDEDVSEDTDNQKAVGPLVQMILDNVDELGDLQELWENDSKYYRLSREIKRYLKDHPKEKIVIFAYFRPTLKYLHERLQKEGISTLLLLGGGSVNKYDAMERFKDPNGPSVLLASEVASEGVDLQFSRVVVNYDLPWNPMKVEQRIGRIDRLGQKSPSITIWNLFYADTIDDRIYHRLFVRLGIFEYALGGLEAILGEEIKNLTIDLLRGALSKEQEEQRITQTEQAISNLKQAEELLEQKASNLIAHGDYILKQVTAAKELGRWITGEDIWIYIRDFFLAHYTGCEFHQLDEKNLIFDIKLSEQACYDLERFAQSHNLIGKSKLALSAYKPIRCKFINNVSHQTHMTIEQINQFHPLTRFVTDQIQDRISHSKTVYFPAVSLQLNSKEIPAVQSADYVFYVERWTIKGVKDIERIVYCAIPAKENAQFLSADHAELIVTAAAKKGVDWLSAINEVNVDQLLPLAESCMDIIENKYDQYISQVENENNDRADLQENALKIHMARQRERLNETIRSHQEKGNFQMIAPTKGLLDKMEARIKSKIRLIEERRDIKHYRKDVCLGLVRVI